MNSKKWFFLLFKALVSIGLLSFLLVKFDFHSFLERVRSINLLWFLGFLLVPHANILLSAVKWGVLLRSIGVYERVPRLFRLYLIGTFFSNFLPTMAGGDIIRVAHLSHGTKKMPAVLAATYMERLAGVTVLIFIVSTFLFNKNLLEKLPVLAPTIVFLVVGYFLLLIVSFHKGLFKRLETNMATGLPGKVFAKIEKVHQCIAHYRHEPLVLIKALIISLVFYLFSVISVYLAAKALGIDIPLEIVLIVVPLVIVVGMLPITLNGLGLNESSYVFFFSLFGVSASAAFSIALLIRFRILLTAVLGGGIFACENARRPVIALKSEKFNQ